MTSDRTGVLTQEQRAMPVWLIDCPKCGAGDSYRIHKPGPRQAKGVVMSRRKLFRCWSCSEQFSFSRAKAHAEKSGGACRIDETPTVTARHFAKDVRLPPEPPRDDQAKTA